MKVYVIFDPLHERVREAYSNPEVAFIRCEKLDTIHDNDYVYPHSAYEIEVDKKYPDDHCHDGYDDQED